jgi:NADH dehydrogenase/putative oxidoreductase
MQNRSIEDNSDPLTELFAQSHGLRTRIAVLLNVGGTAQRAAAPLVDLLARLFLAAACSAPAMLAGGTGANLGAAACCISIVQVAGPALLAVGLVVRPVALLMLVLTLLAPGSGQSQDAHLFCAALLGWYVAEGAGQFSLDRMLRKGMHFSPLPLSGRAATIGRWFDRQVSPAYRLALRLWLAVSLVVPMLAPTSGPTAAAGMLLPFLAAIAVVALALGLATPLVAAGLLVVSSVMAMVGAVHWATPYGALLLALLVVYGPGRYSVDRLIAQFAHRPPRAAGDAPHIVIVGGGFGGMACAAGLRHEHARVTLIDRNNYHLFQPLLYQVATACLSPGDIATPIRGLFRGYRNLSVLCGSVSGVDTAAGHVMVDGQALAYDTLVLATGASHGYFGHDEWAAHAPGLKSVEDATRIRSRILDAFEQAELTDDPATRRKLLTFLIVGAGPTGVELAGAIAELARNGMAKDFRNFDPASARIVLVEAAPRVLPPFDSRMSAFARTSLEALGVEVRVDSKVEAVDANGAVVNGERIFAATVLWAAGVVASPAAVWLGTEPDRVGRIKVAPDLSVPGLPNVFAIGDTALALAWEGRPVPGLAAAAKQAGAYVASVLRARLHGHNPPLPFRYRHRGSLATIGREAAVADFGRFKLTGAAAWWLWGVVHALLLVGLRNRLTVVAGWMWSYFTYDVGVRLITGEKARRGGAVLDNPRIQIATGAFVFENGKEISRSPSPAYAMSPNVALHP